MAILDKLLEIADEYNIADPGTAGTVLLPNQIPLSVARDIGNGQPVYLVIAVGSTEIITGGSAGSLAFRLVSDDTAAIHATTCSKHMETQAFVTDDAAANDAALSAGKILYCGALPLDGGEPYETFLGVQAVIATTTITEGTLNVWLSLTPVHSPRSYPDAVN